MLFPLFCIVALYLAQIDAKVMQYPLAAGMLLGTITLVQLRILPADSHRSLILFFVLLYLPYCILGWAVGKNEVSFGFPVQRISFLEGTLVEDSLLTRSNKQVLRLSLDAAQSKEGNRCSARGVTSALLSVDEVLVASSKVRLKGSYAKDQALFFADDVQVLNLTYLGLLRRSVLEHLERRIRAVTDDPQVQSLISMLVLGQTTESSFLLKDLSLAAGCAHTLALSGMHLQFFLLVSTSFASLLFGRFRGKRVGTLLPFLYVVLAGPKPSLVRALGMHLFSLLPLNRATGKVQAFLATFMVQLVLFPSALSSFACLFSYAAYGLLVTGTILPKFAGRNTILAVLGTAPASLLLVGSWNPMGLVFSYPVTGLINLAMALSVFSLLSVPGCIMILSWIYHLLLKILSLSSLLMLTFSLGGYLVYFVVVLTCVVAIGYAGRALQDRRRAHDELEIRLRFPLGNQNLAPDGDLVDDQEIWAELPLVQSGP